MKKLLLSLVLIFSTTICITANTMNISNPWLLTKVEIEGDYTDLYQILNFKSNGETELHGRIFGTWKIDKEKNLVKIDSKMIKEFSDNWNITKLTDSELILKSTKATMYLISYNPAQIAKDNKKSGLLGVWDFKTDNTEDSHSFLYFQEPNILSTEIIEPGFTSSTKGTWIYDKQTGSVIMTINDYTLRGKSKVLSITSNKLVLKKDKRIITGTKLKQNGADRERLTGEDNNKEQLNYDNCSWFNIETKTSYLKNIEALKYTKSTLLKYFNVFITADLTVGVSWDENRESIITEKIFEDLPAGEYSENNAFYPLEEPFIYTVVGEKKITVPAGTFVCKVIDTNDYNYGDKTRLYMIKNRPGVYAKIINISEHFDKETYTMYELSKIESSYIRQTSNIFQGKWLLVKLGTNGKINKMSTSFEFINDGRLAAKQSYSTNYYRWNYSSDNSTITLDFGKGKQNLTIAKLTESKMVLKNEDLSYSFIKIKPTNTPLSSDESQYEGYWMLTNTSNPYSLIHLGGDRSVYEIERISDSPMNSNRESLKGNWGYDSTEKTLVFNTDQYEALLWGSFNIQKKDKDLLILSDQNFKLVFIKIVPDTIMGNNIKSGLNGIWKIKGKDSNYNYYNFKDPFLFRKGSSPKNMPKTGLWFYNPETKVIFMGYQMHQLEGFSVITKISKNTINFKNGLVAERVQ